MNYKEKEIGGHVWRVNKFMGTTSFKVFSSLIKRVGPSLAGFMNSRDDQGRVDLNRLKSTFEKMFYELDPINDLNFVKELLSQTTCDGNDLNFDLVFQGKMVTLFKVLYFIVEVNYHDFLVESGLVELLNIKKVNQSQPAT